LLPLLQVLLLLSVFLLHSLRLLLVPLFHLLLPRFVGVLLRETLMFLLLLLLQLLVLLILLLDQLVLLLLIFLVQFRVPRVGRGPAFVGLNILRVAWRTRNVVLRTSSILGTTGVLWTRNRLIGPVLCMTRLGSASVGRRMIWRSRFSGRHGTGALEFCRSGSGCDGWFAMVNRGP